MTLFSFLAISFFLFTNIISAELNSGLGDRFFFCMIEEYECRISCFNQPCSQICTVSYLFYSCTYTCGQLTSDCIGETPEPQTPAVVFRPTANPSTTTTTNDGSGSQHSSLTIAQSVGSIAS
ncbi:uncharacterized protein LOC111701886 [Eurytemora carolleeae]|uniref:uncharacterized protein LOC111701886 n=1 Tax=Eurytemora carolleeae TaxID=1294199 RepID=UPI000C787AB9|nr:uncharacterized protein LOC111701886 [Eurytemora carolleeae]|eukprot:XP_023329134.1 uncharacterized protein LOC111701886 [Eurytemora affinis]